MSKQEQLINESLKLAKKGAFKKSHIEDVIRADFYNNYQSASSLMGLYEILSKRYGKGKCTIMSICAT